MIGIPTDEPVAGLDAFDNINLAGSRKVNESIGAIAGFLGLNNWDITEPQFAHMKLVIDLPIVNHGGPFSLIVLYWYGYAYQIYNPTAGDGDPGGNIIPDVGPNNESAIVVGVPVTELMGQNEIIQIMADMMQGVSDFNTNLADFIVAPGNPFDGVAQTIFFEAKVDGPDYNDISGRGNINGGSLFNGVSKFGGYRLTSSLSPSTYMDVTFLNNESGQLLIKSFFGAGTYVFLREAFMADIVMHRLTNYRLLCGPFQFILTPYRYPSVYNPDNIVDVLQGTFDVWTCTPYTPEEQTNHTERAILASGFRTLSPTNVTHDSNGVAVVIGGNFFEGNFTLPDLGWNLLAVNSYFTSQGPLLSPTDMPITTAVLVSISDGQSYQDRVVDPIPYMVQEALIVGFIWDMHFTMRFETVGKRARFGIKVYLAYRSQLTPVECTLWAYTGITALA